LIATGGVFDISQVTSAATTPNPATSEGASIITLGDYPSSPAGGTVALGSKTLTITNGSTTFSGVIQDGGIGGGIGGNLTIAGGTQTLAGVNTYTGQTTIAPAGGAASATLALSGSGSISASSEVAIATGGTFDISQTAGASIKTLADYPSSPAGGTVSLGAQTLTITNGSTTFSGVIQDGGLENGIGGSLTIAGGTQTLAGVNTYTGETTIASAGMATSAELALSGAGSISKSSGVFVATGGTLDISQTTAGASITTLADYPSTPAGGAVSLGMQTLTITNGSTTFSGVIADNGIGGGTGGKLTIAGGTQTLAGVNTFTGQTTISAGTLALSGAGSIASSSNVVDNATFDISGATAGASITTLSGSGTVALGGQTLTLTHQSSTFSGAIGGTGGLTLTGAGTETLSGVNGYTGLTTISAGTLALSGAGSIASSSGVADNGVFDISGTTAGASITTLSGSGAVTLGGQTLTLTHQSSTFSGAIGGAGGLTLTGAGTETLSGANGYTGATTISAGTLALSGAGSIAASTGVVDNGVFDISGTTAGASITTLSGSGAVALGGQTLTLTHQSSTFSGAIGGTGGLTLTGAGTETLSGANGYTGATTISAGTLALSGSGSIAASSGVVDNAAFDISGTTAVASITTLSGSGAVALGAQTLTLTNQSSTFSGAIGGSGGLTLAGAGTETLTGANAYSGGTYLDAGTLAVGNSAALGTGPLTMQDGTVLQFTASGLNLANAIVFPGVDPTIDTGANNDTISRVISGTGGLTKIGSGSLDLTATSTYTGVTTISAGTLVVDGSIASSSSLTIAAGATLGGSGVVPSFVVPSGASVAPGAATPYSTLKVAGSLGFLPGSTYAVQVNAAGASDKIAATGAATLSGGTVNVVAASGVYSPLTRYTILTAGGGVTGTFGSLITTSNPAFAFAFVTPTLSYDTDDVYFGFAQTTSFPSVAQTPNQRATATAIQALGAGAPIYDAVIGESVAGARQAFDALSGEIHASAVSAAFDDTRLPREAVLDRLSSPYGTLQAGGAAGFAAMNAIAGPSVPANVFAGWGQTFGSFGHIGGDGNAATLDRSMGGFILGLDATFDNRYRLGVAAGYTQSTLSLAGRGSSGQVASTYGGVYGGASLNALQLSGGALYAFNHYGTNRSVAFPGFTGADGAGYSGDTLQAFGEAGWRVPLSGLAGPTFVEPIAGLTAMHIETASFTESGGAAALTSASQGYDYAVTTLGVRAEATLFSNVPLLARGMVGWTHVFGDVTPTSTLAFESAPSIPFNIAGAPVARDALAIEAGFDWKLTSNATVGVFYSGSLGNRDVDNAIKGKLEAAF
jgi:fibronectin-binding autotransporter adhesin